VATRRKLLAAAASSSVALGINLGFHHNAFGQAVPLRPGFYVLTDSNGVAYNGKSFSGTEWKDGGNSRILKLSGYFQINRNQKTPAQLNNFKFSLQAAGYGVNNYSSDDPNSTALYFPKPGGGSSNAVEGFVTTPAGGSCRSSSIQRCQFQIPIQAIAQPGRDHIESGQATMIYNINGFGIRTGTYQKGKLIKASPTAIQPSGNVSTGSGFNNTTFLKAGIILPKFQGGTLTVDQNNQTYSQDFTLPQNGTIDVNGNDVTFDGTFTGAGTLALTNSGTKTSRNPKFGSPTNPITLGGLTSTRTSQQAPSTTFTLIGETKISGDTTVNYGVIDAKNSFTTNNLVVEEKQSTSDYAIFAFSPSDASQILTVKNEIKIAGNGNLFIGSASQASTNSTFKVKAGKLNTSSQSTIEFVSPTTIDIQNPSTINGQVTGSQKPLSHFDDLGQYSLPITLRGAGETTFSKSSSVLLRSETNQQRSDAAPDFVVEGKVKINTNNFKLGRYTIQPYALDVSNGNLVIETNGETSGIGTITANVWNEGTVSPGNSIGTLTVDGDYYQGLTNPNATLNIEVDGSTSDLLKITGDNRTVLLGGNLNIGSLPNTHITPNLIYTAIDVTGQGATGGELNLKTDLSGVVGSSGYLFARETSPAFATIDQTYYDTCTSSDPNIQKNCTKLQFAWLQVAKDHKTTHGTKQVITPTGTVPVITHANTKSPATVIKQVKQTGGAITTASSGNSKTNTDTCTANTGNAAACQQQNKSGSGKNGSNANNTQVAKVIDAGQASLGVVVTNGTTGGDPVTVNGVNSGYTTEQTKQAKVSPDFVSVYNALFSIPTRQDLNKALHSISAEPYASMQSVALEAVEQFGKNSLALTDRAVPLTHTETFCKLDDGTLIPADSAERPDTCDERTKTVGSRWSLLLDGTNTEANLDGTSELASLDYNVFSTIYGLQYAFSPQWSAGAAFGYGQANLYNYEFANSRIHSDTYGGSLWGLYRPSADWKISGLIGYMNLQYDSSRHMNFGGLNRTAEADWDGNAFTAALEAQYNWALNGDNSDPNAIRLKPKTFLAYAVHNQGSFSEFGAQSLNLDVDSHTADSVLWGIGFTLETPIRLSSTNRIIPRFTVGYEHDFMGSADEEHQLSSSFSELPALGSMDVLGQNRGADALDLGLSIEIETSDSVSLYAGINGGFWSNGTEVSYGGGLKYSW